MLLKNLSFVERNCMTSANSASSAAVRVCMRIKNVGHDGASRLGDLRKFTPALDNKLVLLSGPTSSFVISVKE